jgi:acetyl/propionyl-CoA carboxylase alpha subunit
MEVAAREAQASFSDGTLFNEKKIKRPQQNNIQNQ